MDLRTGCALWLLKNGLLASYPALDHDEHADVAILGAGITGAVCAYRLARSGVNVVVVDRRDVASGSTAASTGLLQYETDMSLEQLAATIGLEAAVRVSRLGLDAIDRIAALSEEVGDRCGFARRPGLCLASSAGDMERLAREHALQKQHGFDVELFSGDEVQERFGFASHGAMYGRGDGEVDSYRLTHKLLARAAADGARIYDRTNVTRVVGSDTGVELWTENGPRIRANGLICAAGYETAEPRRTAVRGLPSVRRLTNLNSTWACASEPVASFDGWEDRCLVWETARPYFYLRSTDDGRVLMGGEDSPYAKRHESTRLLKKKAASLIERFGAMFPGIAVQPAYTWAGVFAETADGLPFIGQRHGYPHVWYARGYGANGITFGVIAADLLRDLWLGVPNPDAALFRFDRPR